MKAAVWTTEGTLEIKVVPMPTIQGPQDVIARVRASGICGSDLHGWRAPRLDWVGKITGHELAGEVVEIGKDVTNVEVGNRVAIESYVECGLCRWCKVGHIHLCPNAFRMRSETLSRGFSQYVRGPSVKFTKLADHVKTEWAPLLDCYGVNIHAFQVADLKMFETIAVIGQGSMGLSMTDIANAVGVKTIAIALRNFSLSIAKKMGAWETINSTKEDPVQKVLALTNGYGADTTFLQLGGKNPNPLKEALKMTKKGGKVLIVGLTTGGNIVNDFDAHLLRGEKMLKYVNNASYWGEYSENAIALDFLTRGKLHPKELITHRFPLQQINEAFETAINKKKTNAIKVMIIQDEEP